MQTLRLDMAFVAESTLELPALPLPHLELQTEEEWKGKMKLLVSGERHRVSTCPALPPYTQPLVWFAQYPDPAPVNARMKNNGLKVTCPHCHSDIGWMDSVQPSSGRKPQSRDTFTCVECKGVSRFSLDKHSKLFLRPLTASQWYWVSADTKAKIFSVGGLLPEGATWFSTWSPPVCIISVKPDVYEWIKDVDFNAVPKLSPPDPEKWRQWQESRRAKEWERAELLEAKRTYRELRELLRTKRREHKANTAVVKGA